ncbi:MAG: aldo/keto reductase [Polyangiaceae bacterium]
MIDRRQFGLTGLDVPALGLGGGPLGNLDEHAVDALVGRAVELGVALVDVAPSYGDAEVRLGHALRGRRDKCIVSTKVGYGVPGVADWTAPAVTLGVERALRRLGGDALDVVYLHSCPVETLAFGEVLDALAAEVHAGRVRVAGYSGEGAALDYAISDSRISAVQMSASAVDQANLGARLHAAKQRGLGVLAKRVVGNAFFAFPERPARDDVAVYWDRARALTPMLSDHVASFGWAELCLRFVAFTWGVDCALIGASRAAHLELAAQVVSRGPLPEAVVRDLYAAWSAVGEGWSPLV